MERSDERHEEHLAASSIISSAEEGTVLYFMYPSEKSSEYNLDLHNIIAKS
jgi:hypothetical protein